MKIELEFLKLSQRGMFRYISKEYKSGSHIKRIMKYDASKKRWYYMSISKFILFGNVKDC